MKKYIKKISVIVNVISIIIIGATITYAAVILVPQGGTGELNFQAGSFLVGAGQNKITTTTAMVVYNSKIGIGTTTPDSLLTVAGAFAVGTNGTEFTIDSNGNVVTTGYASSTTGLFTQGNGHIGGNLTIDGNATTTGSLHLGGSLYVDTLYDTSGGKKILEIKSIADDVNYIEIYSNPTGGAPYIKSAGSDTNISLGLYPKGTGAIYIHQALSVGGSASSTSFRINDDFTIDASGNATTTGHFAALGGNSDEWNLAYGWGDHSLVGYGAAWEYNSAADAMVTTSTKGIMLTASSSIGADFRIDGNATTTGWLYIGQDLTVNGMIHGNVTGNLTGQADTVATIAGLAPNTATTQATQAAITSAANLVTVGTLTGGATGAGFTLDFTNSTLSGNITTANIADSYLLNTTDIGTGLTLSYSTTTGTMTIPQGASITTANAGEIGIDTTSNQFKFYGTSEQVIVAYKEWGGTYSSSTIATSAATTTMAEKMTILAETFVTGTCFTDTGTTTIAIGDVTNYSYFDCPRFQADAPANNKFTFSSNNTFTADEYQAITVGNFLGSPTRISFNIYRTINAD